MKARSMSLARAICAATSNGCHPLSGQNKCRSLVKVQSRIDGLKGFSEGGVTNSMIPEEVSQSEYAQANLSVNFGRQVLTRITHPCPSMESDQFGHTFDKSRP